jgi:hypothetical protein
VGRWAAVEGSWARNKGCGPDNEFLFSFIFSIPFPFYFFFNSNLNPNSNQVFEFKDLFKMNKQINLPVMQCKVHFIPLINSLILNA